MNRLSSVLIADVMESRREARLRSLLSDRLASVTKVHLREKRIRLAYAITAGDEFQAIPRRIADVPSLIFDLRRRLRPLSLRIGIGIGEIPEPIRGPVNRMGGEAFVFAREAIDSVKDGSLHPYRALTAFRSARKSFDRLANLVYGLHDTLLLDITDSQWRTIDAYFRERGVERAARSLKLDKSTASRSLKRGSYWQLEEVATKMTEILKDEWT
jgi:SatD family (SatD)